ncbi:MAG TPA: phosphoenolpyruvate carboxylase, partial [Thermomicrobiales bacterium]|nr:phosphoenolpyruvate carboxylase [Thermomicrobiales bacterium]
MTDVANGQAAGNAASGRTLSDDIYFLVGILGEAIQAVAGRDAFELEEAARALAKNLRRGELDASAELQQLVHEADTEDLRILIRAFTNYFQLINLSEDNERIRRVRQREHREPDRPRRGSIREAVLVLAERGITAVELQALLDDAQVRLVLT